jgi:hypothetical protein
MIALNANEQRETEKRSSPNGPINYQASLKAPAAGAFYRLAR